MPDDEFKFDLRFFIVLIGFTELILFLLIFLSPMSLQEHRMVSTNLVLQPAYMYVLTSLVFISLIICLVYLIRYIDFDKVWTVIACAFVFSACMGWILVITNDPDEQKAAHATGAGIFVASTGVYFACMLRLTYRSDPVRKQGYDIAVALIAICDLVFAVLYAALYFANSQDTWIFENIAFAGMILIFIIFFWLHPFDPTERIKISQQDADQANSLLRA